MKRKEEKRAKDIQKGAGKERICYETRREGEKERRREGEKERR